MPSQPARLPVVKEWLVFVVGWLVVVPLMLLLAPVGLADSWQRERRLNRLYRKANRLLPWARAKELASATDGTLIIEVHLLEKLRHVWWIGRDLKAIEPNLAAASRVLERSIDIEELLRLLHSDAARAWWEAHLQELRESAFLVRMPFSVSRQRDELLAMPRAIVVDSSWTLPLREPL